MNYWKEAELINGRLAMLGLIIGTINYGLFGMDSTRFILKTTIKRRKINDTRGRKINGWAAMLGS